MCVVQCAYFGSPLDQEFLNACNASVVLDPSRFSAGKNAEDGRVPSRGVATSKGCNGRCELPFGGGIAIRPSFPFCVEVEKDA